MQRRVVRTPLLLFAVMASAVALSACTPKYDWRDVRGDKVPFTVLLPAKPSVLARPVNLGGIQATMTMTAAEVGEVTFAVGTAELPDAAQAQAALQIMKATLVKNIGGVIRHEKSIIGTSASTIDLDAATTTGGDPRALHARLVARDRRVYQAIVIGREKSIRQEAVDTFLTSFKTE
ncbi:MAG: hypothetical protein H7327_05130 [Herminiimonas sp.]|nr:hypothetical protein [Herminiimonas sp.]